MKVNRSSRQTHSIFFFLKRNKHSVLVGSICFLICRFTFFTYKIVYKTIFIDIATVSKKKPDKTIAPMVWGRFSFRGRLDLMEDQPSLLIFL